MPTKGTSCNKALRRIGEGRVNNLDYPFNSALEQDLSEIYDEVVDEVLCSGAFRFAIKVRSLGALADAESEEYDYVYAKPADCLKPLALVDPTQGAPLQFEETAQGLETDESPVSLRYVARVTDPALFDKLFVSALAWRIAAEVATSIGKPELAAQAWNGYRAEIRVAQGASSNAARKPNQDGMSTINARNA